MANQHFGWSEGSNTAAKYEHLFQDDAERCLAEALGGIRKETLKPKIPRRVECPKCKYQNTPETPFCIECRIPLSVAGHLEREHEFIILKEQMSQMRSDFNTYDKKVKEALDKVRDHIKWQDRNMEMHQKMFATLDRLTPGWAEPYWETLRRPLTEKERERIDGFLEQLLVLLEEDCLEMDGMGSLDSNRPQILTSPNSCLRLPV